MTAVEFLHGWIPLATLFLTLVGFWVRQESRISKLEAWMSDLQHIVLNGGHKKAAITRRKK
jgi:hypothetical protein